MSFVDATMADRTMSASRLTELAEHMGRGSLRLTKREIADGWHYCSTVYRISRGALTQDGTCVCGFRGSFPRMSFMLTPRQLKDGSKDITRRLGWRNLRAGQRLLAVHKCQGLKKGEKAEVYGPIEVVSVRREPLKAITQDDVVREGFPEITPREFVAMFCQTHRDCTPITEVARIEFRKVGW